MSVVFELDGVDQQFAGDLQGGEALAFLNRRSGLGVGIEKGLDHFVPGRISD